MVEYKQYLAKTFFGLENVLADEIEALGGQDINIIKRGVEFSGDKKLLYKANLHLRTALRVLIPIKSFRARTDEQVYKRVYNMEWEKILDPSLTFAIDSIVYSEIFTHSKYIGLKVKDAIVDRLREKFGSRPNIDPRDPDVQLNLHISEDQVTISIDTSGNSLHLRGYRIETNEAPINEVLAAGLVLLSNWDRKTTFVDPMCGSGTILIEAAMIAKNMAPGLTRKNFGLQNWKDYDRSLWNQVVAEANEQVKDFSINLIGGDKNMRDVRIAEKNIESAGLSNIINVKRQDFFRPRGNNRNVFILFNPPYGERLEEEDIADFYNKIGSTLKHKYADCSAWMITSSEEGIKKVGLKPSKKIHLYNGKLNCQFLKYDIFDGSLKEHKSEI